MDEKSLFCIIFARKYNSPKKEQITGGTLWSRKRGNWQV